MSKEDRLDRRSGDSSGSTVIDYAAFLAVLVTGVVLITATHVSPETFGGYLLAIAALFYAWRR